MQKARRHGIAPLRPLVSARFQVLCTPLSEVLFTFPSQYWFTIGLLVVFSLARWCWLLQGKFLRFPHTQDAARNYLITYTRLSLSTALFPNKF